MVSLSIVVTLGRHNMCSLMLRDMRTALWQFEARTAPSLRKSA